MLPSTGVVEGVLTEAVELGYERRDIAALFEVLARKMPLDVTP